MTTPQIALSLDDAALDLLADTLAERVCARLARSGEQSDGWLDSTAAAEHLGISRDAMHKLTSGRQLKFSQTVHGAPCFFRRADLDAYREQFMRGGR